MSSAIPTGGTLPIPSYTYQSLVVLPPSDCSAAVETLQRKPAGKGATPPSVDGPPPSPPPPSAEAFLEEEHPRQATAIRAARTGFFMAAR